MSGSFPIGGASAEGFDAYGGEGRGLDALPAGFADDDLPEYTREQLDEMDQWEDERRQSEWALIEAEFEKAKEEGFAGDIWAFEQELRAKAVADLRQQVANQPQNLIKQLQEIGSALKREQHPLAGDVLRLVQPLRDIVDAAVAPQRHRLDSDHELMDAAAERIRRDDLTLRAEQALEAARQGDLEKAADLWLSDGGDAVCAREGCDNKVPAASMKRGRPRKFCDQHSRAPSVKKASKND